jgi:adenylate cyclase
VVQVPFAFISSFAWKYVDINREKTNIRKAFSFYLPDEVINNISHSFSYALESSRVAPGIFLSTDVEHYTSLSEQMTPDELGSHLNKYFEVIFRAVKSHDGVISNVIADSVLAFWGSPDAPLGRQASLAALDIMEAVRRFNESMKDAQLPTRIGLHYGDVILGKIGALDRFELRHVGDTVNTATRIEGLNKLLGTRVLMSDEVFTRSDGFLCRELGTFLLLNKLKPVVVHELISLADKSTEEQRDLCALFSDALGEFNRQSWNESSDKFNEIIKRFGEDGPSSYYLNLCEQYMKKPPDESWDGIIRIDKK